MKIDTYKLNESYGFFFNLISTNMKIKLEAHLKQFDVTSHQFGILLIVLKKENLTQRDIIKFTNGDEPSTARVIARLEEKGLILRIKGKDDKRKKLVSLTQEAKSLLQKMLPYAEQENEKLVASLSSEEQETLLNLLRKISQTI